jgi:hypothetical protein
MQNTQNTLGKYFCYIEAQASGGSVDTVNNQPARQPRNCGSIPGRGKRFLPSSKTSRPTLGPTMRPIQWVTATLSLLASSRGAKLNNPLYLMSRISGAIPPLSFMACLGIIFPIDIHNPTFVKHTCARVYVCACVCMFACANDRASANILFCLR